MDTFTVIISIENYTLFVEAEKRMKADKPSDFIRHDGMLDKLGITKEDLNGVGSRTTEKILFD